MGVCLFIFNISYINIIFLLLIKLINIKKKNLIIFFVDDIVGEIGCIIFLGFM